MGADDKPKPKDRWDKLGLITGPMIALVGIFFTYTWNAHQAVEKTAQELEARRLAESQLTLQRLAVIRQYYDELTHDDTRHRARAILLIKNSGDNELATRLATQFHPQSLEDNFAQPAVTTAALPPALAERAGSTGTGWAYLGNYEAAARQWRTRYFDFSANALPASLVGTAQRVSDATGDLNVRAGMPNPNGPSPDVVTVLPPRQKVNIVSVQRYENTGYHWAQIEYDPPEERPQVIRASAAPAPPPTQTAAMEPAAPPPVPVTITSTAPATSTAAVVPEPAPIVPEQPALVAATAQLKTGSWSSKKAPTRVTVQLRAANDELLAQGESVGTEYPFGSTQLIVLQPQSVRRDRPKPYKLTVFITTDDDSWNFEATVALRWTDGKVTTSKFRKMKVDEHKPSATETEL